MRGGDGNRALFTAIGNPLDRRTWSGTPKNLYGALAAQGLELEPVNAALSRPARVAAFLRAAGEGTFQHTSRLPWARRRMAAVAARAAASRGIERVLHTSSLDLPDASDRREFLFCDSTWNLWSRFSETTQKVPARIRKLIDESDRVAYRTVERFFAISTAVKTDLIDHYSIPEARIDVVLSGRGGIRPLQGAKDSSGRNILFVAKTRFREKGGPVLLEAFLLARKRDPNLTIAFVVERKVARTLRGLPGVSAHSDLPWADLEQLFHEANVYAMPASNEPWGLVYIEALVAGAPVVAVRRNGILDITDGGRFGFLVDSPDPVLVSEALLEAFRDPDRLAGMSAEAVDYATARFSWAETARKMAPGMEMG